MASPPNPRPTTAGGGTSGERRCFSTVVDGNVGRHPSAWLGRAKGDAGAGRNARSASFDGQPPSNGGSYNHLHHLALRSSDASNRHDGTVAAADQEDACSALELSDVVVGFPDPRALDGGPRLRKATSNPSGGSSSSDSFSFSSSDPVPPPRRHSPGTITLATSRNNRPSTTSDSDNPGEVLPVKHGGLRLALSKLRHHKKPSPVADENAPPSASPSGSSASIKSPPTVSPEHSTPQTPTEVTRSSSNRDLGYRWGSFGASSRSSTDYGMSPGARSPSNQGFLSRSPSATRSMGLASRRSSSILGEHVKETTVAKRVLDPETGQKMINGYRIIRELGRGCHGKVKLCEDGDTGQAWALKIVPKKTRARFQSRLHTNRLAAASAEGQAENPDLEKIMREIAILKKCDHPHVVGLREVIDDPASEKIFLVLEYLAGGDIKWQSRDHDGPVQSLEDARRIFQDVVCGVEYLHYQGIVHRDIKPANLLWTTDSRVKISDFGVSVVVQTQHTTDGSVVSKEEQERNHDLELAKTAGTPAFFAPEMCGTPDDDEFEDDQSDSSTYGEDTDYTSTTFDADTSFLTASETGIRRLDLPPLPPELDRPPRLPSPSNGNGVAQIRDASAGFAALSPHKRLTRTNSRPDPRPPPVQNVHPPIGKAIDIWAIGVTLYCLVFGRVPFTAESEFELFNVISRKPLEFPPGFTIDPSLEDLLYKLLTKDPTMRITLEEIKLHPWTTGNMNSAQRAAWLQDTDPTIQYGAPVQVTDEEMRGAVTMMGKLKSGLRKLSSSFHSLTAGLRNRTKSAPSVAAAEDDANHPDGHGHVTVTDHSGKIRAASAGQTKHRGRRPSPLHGDSSTNVLNPYQHHQHHQHHRQPPRSAPVVTTYPDLIDHSAFSSTSLSSSRTSSSRKMSLPPTQSDHDHLTQHNHINSHALHTHHQQHHHDQQQQSQEPVPWMAWNRSTRDQPSSSSRIMHASPSHSSEHLSVKAYDDDDDDGVVVVVDDDEDEDEDAGAEAERRRQREFNHAYDIEST
ncbi:hypothetical protein HKX48_004909 [Thoreauomyces humboldtii]|nr:hypothetical protein HKX48_004909 [Thoreauomyces humboldtii]